MQKPFMAKLLEVDIKRQKQKPDPRDLANT